MDDREEWLKKLQEEAKIPDIVWQKAEQSFEQIRKRDKQNELIQNGLIKEKKTQKEKMQKETSVRHGKKKHRQGRRKAAIVILAATLLISTLTAGAATYFHWNNQFSERYHVSPEIEKILNDSNTAKELTQYTEHDGLRIEAVQSVADSHMAHIILRIQGSDGFSFDDKMNFGSVDVKLEGDVRINYTAQFLDGYTERDRSNGADYEVMIQDPFEEGILNKEIILTFNNVVNEYEGKLNRTEKPVLIDSTWELKLPLDNEDSGKVYEVNQQIPGSEAVIKRIRLSSISYTMDMEWTPKTEVLKYIDENGTEGTFEHAVGPPGLNGVVYEDGSVREGVSCEDYGEFINDEKTEYRQTGSHIELIDYENVSELIFYVNGSSEPVRVPVQK